MIRAPAAALPAALALATAAACLWANRTLSSDLWWLGGTWHAARCFQDLVWTPSSP